MRPTERREKIVDLVRERQRMTVEDLAAELDSSRETIRRDLTELSNRGVLKKFHGGAMRPEIKLEGSYAARMLEHVREKRAVAQRAAEFFGPGDTLFIDTGTTTVLFAEELARRSGVTAITNSVAIAQIMARGQTRCFLIGGEYREDAAENVGTLAVEQIQRFHASHAVLTVGAVDASGIMDFQLEEAEVARAMVMRAQTVTVIADHSKLGRSALFQVCPLNSIDRLVVNARPDRQLEQALGVAGVEIIVAHPG